MTWSCGWCRSAKGEPVVVRRARSVGIETIRQYRRRLRSMMPPATSPEYFEACTICKGRPERRAFPMIAP